MPHCPSDHLLDAPGIAFRMDEREPNQPSGVGAHDAGDFGVGLGVVEMEGGEDDSLRDSRRIRAAQVGLDRRLGVPRPGNAIPAANVTMAIDDHGVPGLAAVPEVASARKSRK